MGQVFEFGLFRLDSRSGQLLREDRELHLTAKAYATLLLLVERAGALVSKDEILATVWPEGFVEPANLTQTIYVLRKTLSDSDSTLIETLPGRGYRFTAAVRCVADRTSETVAGSRPKATTTRTAVWSFPLALVLFAALTLHSSIAPQVPKVAINPQAQRNYILGRHYWNQRTMASLQLGLKYFKTAISIAPNYAQAYSGVADSYSTLAYYGPMGPQKRKYTKLSRDAALHAIALDPNIPEPHASLAFADELIGPSCKSQIEPEFKRSIALDNTYATAHEWYAWYLYYNHRHAEALEHMKQARNLDPTSPIINFALGYLLFFDHQFNAAADQWHQTIALEPYSAQSYLGAGLADEQLGRHQMVLGELRRALTLTPHDPDIMGALAYEYARVKQRDAAGRLLTSISKMKPIPAFDVALANDGLGHRTQAIKWLAIAEDSYQVDRLQVALDPRLDDLRQTSVGSRDQNSNG